MTMNNDNEPYSGYRALVSYIKDNNKQCSYAEFLDLNRDIVLLSPPFSDKWNVLDLTWARRFLKEAKEEKELKERDYATLEEKTKKQRANKGLQIYWEGIIYEREKMEAQRAHLTGSMRVYSKVAECNSETLSSGDYSNIFPSFDSVRERKRNESVVTLSPQHGSYTQAHLSNASMFPGIEAETDVFSSERDELDTSEHEDAIDDQEVKDATNDKVEVTKENKTGPLRLSEANRGEIDTAYNLMDKQYMWRLSSGKFVEEELYKLGKGLEFEHAVHSFILDVEDELIMEHFTETELREIDNTSIPEVPELSNEIDEFLNKFLGKTNLNEIRQIIKESSFGNDYDHEKHHDLDYICLALHSLVREIQNGSIKDTNLENWYNCHVWSVVFDQAFGDIRAIAGVKAQAYQL